jgi:hypothetical protein
MSAAATAAGYLYASGRLRGKGARDQDNHQPEEKKHATKEVQREPVRVAVLPERDDRQEDKPRKTPKVEYRVRRRWSAA